MATDKTKLDDFDFDRIDMDLGGLTNSSQAKKQSKREAIAKVSTSFAAGAKEVLTDETKIRSFAAKALPDGYGTALNTAFDAKEGFRDLYNDAVQQLKPAMPFLRKVAGKLTENERSFLPKGIADRLKTFANETDNTGFIESQASLDNKQIQGELGGIFQSQMELSAQQHQEDQNRQLLRDEVQVRQNVRLAQLMEMTRSNTARLVAYQDQITHHYQRKSLELQYRQLFATRDMLASSLRREQSDRLFLDAIVKNTSLPEYKKLKMHEAAGQSFRDKLLNRSQSSVSNFVSKFGENLKKNLMTASRNTIGNLVGSAQMGETMMDSAKMQEDLERELEELGMPRESKTQKAANKAGGFLTEFLLNRLATPTRKFLDKHKKIRQTGAQLAGIFENLPEILNQYAQSDTQSTGLRGFLEALAKEVLPKFSLDKTIGGSPLTDADRPATFDNLTRRSIVEVIPGYLSRIHREIVVLRTGNDSIKPLTYNIDRGEFTEQSQAVKDAARRIFSPVNVTDMQDRMGEMIKIIDPNDKMDPQLRQKFAKQILTDVASGNLFSKDRYGSDKETTQYLSVEDKQALKSYLDSALNGSDGSLDKVKNLEAMRKFKTLQQTYSNIDPRSTMSVYRDSGNREILNQLGILDRVGFTDRMNYDKVADILLGVQENPGGKMGSQPSAGGSGPSNPGSAFNGLGSNLRGAANEARNTLSGLKGGIRDAIEKKNLSGLSKSAREKFMNTLNNARRISGSDVMDRWEHLSEASRTRIAAVVSRAAGSIKVSAKDLYNSASASIFDALKPSDIQEVERIINADEGAGDTSNTEARPAPTGKGSLFDTIGSLGRTNTAAPESGPAPVLSQVSDAELLDVNKQQLEVLGAIYEAVLANGGGGGPGGERQTMFGKAGRWFGKGVRGLSGGLGKAAGWYGQYAKAVLTSPKYLINTGLNIARGLISRKKQVVDIYVVGEDKPVLKKSKLLRGDYRDVKTKKPIRRANEIKNPIIDVTNPDAGIVVDEEMIQKGFYTLLDGKPTLLGRALGTLGSVATTMLGAYGQMFKLPFMLTGAAFRFANQAIKKLFNGKKDVYVKGDPKVRLRAIYFDGKHYVTASGKGITHIGQLKEVILDRATGNVLITDEELPNLVDQNGRPLQTGAGRLMGMAGHVIGGIATGVSRVVGGLARGVGSLIGGSYELGGGILGRLFKTAGSILNPGEWGGYSKKSIKILTQIRDLLDSRLPGKKARKGSWEERMEDKAAADAAAKNGKDSKTNDPTNSLWGKFSSLFKKGKNGLASLFGLGGDDDEDEDGGGGDTTIISGSGGGKEEGAKAKKPRGRMGRAWDKTGGRLTSKLKGSQLGGLFGKMKGGLGKLGRGKAGIVAAILGSLGLSALADKIPGGNKAMDVVDDVMTARSLLSIGSRAIPAATTVATGGGATAAAGAATGAAALEAGAGATALAGAGGAAATGGLGAALTIGLPVTLAAAAIGYGIYKGYKKYKYGTWLPLRSYRMTQYGVDYSDSSDVEDIVKLEQMLEPTVSQMGGGLDLKAGDVNMSDVYELFGVDDGIFSNNADQRKIFDSWFNARFKPIFLTWMSALKTVKGATLLNDADDSLEAVQKQQLLRAARSVPAGVYSVKAGPWGKMLDGDIDADRIQQIYLRAESDIKDQVEGKGGAMSTLKRWAQAVNTISPFGSLNNKVMEWAENRKFTKDKLTDPDALAKSIGDTGPGGTGGAAAGYGKVSIAGTASVGLVAMGRLTALQGIRLRTYGLTQLTPDRVNQLLSLESELMKSIKLGSAGEPATANLDLESLYKKYSPQFGVDPNDGEMKIRWCTWLQYRFVPTLLAYVNAAKAALNSNDLTNIDGRLKSNQKFDVATAVTQARMGGGADVSVWKMYYSPWDAKEKLNENPNSVHGALLALKNGVKSEVVDEEKVPGQDAQVKKNKDQLNALTSDAASKSTSMTSKIKDWLFGNNQTGSAGLMDRVKSGFQAVGDNLREAGSRLMSGDFAGAAGAAMNAATAPARYVANVNVPDLKISGNAKDRESMLVKMAIEHGINNPAELAMLLGQVAEESGGFKHLVENLKYNPARAKQMWPNRFRDAAHAASILAQGPQAFAEFIYGGRRDLGNVVQGDGWKYRGRGLIQLTGRANYAAFAKWSKLDVLNNPDLVATDPKVAALSAVFYWLNRGRGIRQLAASGDVVGVTKLVNGGTNNLETRRGYFNQYMRKFQGKNIQQIAAEFGAQVGAGGSTGDTATASTTTAGTGAKADFSGVSSSVDTSQGNKPAGASPTVAQSVAALAPAATAAGTGAPAIVNTSAPATTADTPAPSAVQMATYQQTTMQDSVARQKTTESNTNLDSVADILQKQLQSQQAAENYLAQLVALASKSGGLSAAAGSGNDASGSASSMAPQKESVGLPKLPIDVSRKLSA